MSVLHTDNPTPTKEQWMEDFRRGLRWHLETYFAAGNGISGEDALRLATDTITFQVSELLTTQLESARREERERCIKVVQGIENEEVSTFLSRGGAGMVGRTWVATDQVIQAISNHNSRPPMKHVHDYEPDMNGTECCIYCTQSKYSQVSHQP